MTVTAPPLGRQGVGLLSAEQVRELASLRPKDRVGNWAYLAVTWLVIAGAFTAAGLYRHWWVLVLAFLVISSRQQSLLNIEHDCIHASFTRDKRRDQLVGIIACASPCGSPWHATRARHLAHHRLITTPDDPDLPLHDTADKASKWALVRYFGLGLLGGYAVMVLLSGAPSNVDAKDKIRDLRNLALSQLVIWGATWAAFGEWWLYLALWVLPLITLTTVCHLIRSFVEHAVLTDERPDHDNLLVSISSNPLELAFLAPFNMNYHAEHHLYPAVPARRLPDVRVALADSPQPPRLIRSAYLTALLRYAGSLGGRSA
ncbi:MAG TPA: fatty acid desaturase family protein [Mycobacteriales bacterium]|nr:fatty acid desaturase family protein [Mycobacteriales bacterium]